MARTACTATARVGGRRAESGLCGSRRHHRRNRAGRLGPVAGARRRCGLINVATPTFAGTAEAGRLSCGCTATVPASPFAQTSANALGDWSFAVSAAWADGRSFGDGDGDRRGLATSARPARCCSRSTPSPPAAPRCALAADSDSAAKGDGPDQRRHADADRHPPSRSPSSPSTSMVPPSAPPTSMATARGPIRSPHRSPRGT